MLWIPVFTGMMEGKDVSLISDSPLYRFREGFQQKRGEEVEQETIDFYDRAVIEFDYLQEVSQCESAKIVPVELF